MNLTPAKPGAWQADHAMLCSFRVLQNQLLLFQKHWWSGHHGNPPPIPHHNDEDTGCKESLHGKPHFGETSILVDSLEQNQQNFEGEYIFILFSTSKCILERGEGRSCLLNFQDQELSHSQHVFSPNCPSSFSGIVEI